MINDGYLQVFCDNVRNLRMTHHLSRTAMAKRCGVSLTTLDSLESGVLPKGMTVKVFFCISQSFGIPIPQLFQPMG